MSRASALPVLLLAFACAGSRPDREPTREQPKGPAPVAIPSGWPPSVVTVRGDRVAISAGSVEKVRVGDCFNLSCGSRYVGRISIIAVDDRNISVGVFDTAHAGGAAPPEVGDRAVPASPPAYYVGVVMAVRGDRVSVSLGAADGVRVGDYLDLSRAGNQVGRLRIVSTEKNLSVGVFESVIAGSKPEIGDLARFPPSEHDE